MSEDIKLDEQVKRGPDGSIDLEHVNDVLPSTTEEIEQSGDIISEDPDRKKVGTGVIIDDSDPIADFVTQPLGTKVYDRGESIVSKMNNQQAIFDKDLFFTELFENYLVVEQRNDLRHLPSGIVTRWDMHTSFGDFLNDALNNCDDQLTSIKMAREAHSQKFKILGDDILSEMKIDSGSDIIGQQYNAEDYEATEELLRRSKEIIGDYLAGRTAMTIDQKSGRVSIVNPQATK